MKEKNTKDAVQSFLELYAQMCLESTDDEFDWHSDPKAVALLRAIEKGEDLSGQDFSGVNLKNAVISGAKLRNANLSGAILYNTVIEDSDLNGVDFSGSHWENTTITRTDLTNISIPLLYVHNLSAPEVTIDPENEKKITALHFLTEKLKAGEIDLKELSWTDLLSVNFSEIDLSGISLDEVDLSCLSLESINLKGTYIDPKQVRSLQGLLHYQDCVQQESLKKLIAEKLKKIYLDKQIEAPTLTAEIKKIGGQTKQPFINSFQHTRE